MPIPEASALACHRSATRTQPPLTLSSILCRRYGLLGPNGCGKSCLLKALGAREVPIPEHIDIFVLDKEMAGSDLTALEAVMEVDAERDRLEREAEWLADKDGPDVEQRLEDIYERWACLSHPQQHCKLRPPMRLAITCQT